MKKVASLSLIAAVLAMGGCFKQSAESTIKNDGSATVKLSLSYKTEVVKQILEQIEQASEMMGDSPELEKAKERMAKVEEAFSDKKAAEEWKKLGLEVTKSTSSEKDGWKGFEIEGSAKNISEYNRKVAESKKAGAEDDKEDPARFAIPRFPKFYKTDQPNVAKIVLGWRDSSQTDAQMKQLENIPDEQREQIQEAFEAQRAMLSLDDLKIQLRIRLPGKILSVSNAKQDGENTLVFEMLGSSINLDTLSKLGQLPSATMQFDPKEFKIPLEDEPKGADSKPASKPVEKPKKDEEEKKEKEEDK
jgi:hypothetical protein